MLVHREKTFKQKTFTQHNYKMGYLTTDKLTFWALLFAKWPLYQPETKKKKRSSPSYHKPTSSICRERKKLRNFFLNKYFKDLSDIFK